MADGPLADRVSLVLETQSLSSASQSAMRGRRRTRGLAGVVRSYYQKQMAQEMLKNVDGVNEIENQLEVCWM